MSETTKRISEIIEYHECHHGVPSAVYSSEFKHLAKAISTHLHQEVIRGKIEILDTYMNRTEEYSCACFKVVEDMIADLEQQITPNAKESK